MKKIGLTPCFLYPEPGRKYFAPKTLTYLENDMLAYLTTKDALPVLLCDWGDEHLERVMDEIDGVVFAGGSDVCPESYGEDYLDKEKWPGDKTRDDFELKIFQMARKRKMPIYAICRGCQVANVGMGGTLIQDINTEVKTPVEHRNAEKYDQIHHDVEFVKDGVLEKIYADSPVREINTVHHQAIKRLGEGLVVEATSPEDGLIEAFRSSDESEGYLLAVQWHPEFSPTLGEKILDPDPLYRHFLAAVDVYKGKKNGN